MAKPIVQFNAVSFDIGTHKGLRPQLVSKDAVTDLDLCREVVNERRLTTSAEELMHGFSSLADVAMKKVAEDGRPRAITKLIKFAPFATGSLESPSSPWNESCKAIVRAVLLSDAKKELDATFQNTTSGIGVKLNDVTYDGAKTVQNVIKQDGTFSANGSHMEFIEGDTAELVVGETVIPLVCKESDVSHARFDAPAALYEIEPGTTMLFRMKSRGGVEGGQAYTTKKNITLLAGEPKHDPKIVSMVGEMSGKDGVSKGWYDPMTITLENASTEGAKVRRVLYDGKIVDAETGWNMESVKLEVVSPTVMKVTFEENVTRETFEIWRTKYRPVTEVQLANGTILSVDMSFEEED